MSTQPKSLRLNLRASPQPAGRFDGSWWPRSPDLVAELRTVIRVLSARMGVVRKVRYNLDTWGPLAKWMNVDGHAVRLEGFTGQDPYSLLITGVTPGVLGLLVVPWDADELAGAAALTAALIQNGFSRDILAACGVDLAAGAARR